jgi:shikimate dehydrogenase
VTTGQRKIYGLIGYPLGHSLSPFMQNAAFAALKVNAAYKLFPLKEGQIQGFLKGLLKNYIFGLNVTVPYKEKVIPFLDSVSGEAKFIGAVNTIKRVRGKLLGFNTDAEGFSRSLARDLRFDPKGKNIAVLGAGGAARAVSVALGKMRAARIAIYDVDLAKAQALVRHLRKNMATANFSCVDSVAGLEIKNVDLLVNATPQGMKESQHPPVGKDLIHRGLLVYDLIYNPAETKLVKLAKEEGAGGCGGLGMLLYQGMRSFEIWTGKKAPQKIMSQALEEAIKR